MHDIHTHIGQFWNTYYNYHDVFLALTHNGITEIGLKTNILYWADPLVLKNISFEEIFNQY